MPKQSKQNRGFIPQQYKEEMTLKLNLTSLALQEHLNLHSFDKLYLLILCKQNKTAEVHYRIKSVETKLNQ